MWMIYRQDLPGHATSSWNQNPKIKAYEVCEKRQEVTINPALWLSLSQKGLA